MMGIETELVAVLQDLVQFLESLSDIYLPHSVQNMRDTLLQRSRTSLVAVCRRSTTPEPYLDMNAGKCKGLHPMVMIDSNNITTDNQITEYMYADNSNQLRLSSSQDYYESFSANDAKDSVENMIESQSTKAEQEIRSIYKTFSYSQTLSKASKSGPLNLKEERRIFRFQLFGGFDQFRSYFIGLVGSHLLIYATKHDKHPYDIISIRGYSARASPNAIPRDLERSKCAFEIFSPGNRTFQFTARSPKEMEQWVAMICRTGNVTSSSHNTESTITNPVTIKETTNTDISEQFIHPEEQYQDVGHIKDGRKGHIDSVIVNDAETNTENDVILRKEEKFSSSMSPDGHVDPPPLPARIPRRLPSLPHEPQSSKLDSVDDIYDEDDIYHKIEDVKLLSSTYQNLTSANQTQRVENDEKGLKHKTKKLTEKKTTESFQLPSSPRELYDDAQPIEIPKVHLSENEKESTTYDDIHTILDDKRETLVSESRKKSFLDRVRYRKETPKKDNSKKKLREHKSNSNKNSVQSQLNHGLPPYDDIFTLDLHIQKGSTETPGDYTCPSAPRSIYEKPASSVPVDHHDKEDFYDDIGAIQNNKDNRFVKNLSKINTFKSPGLIDDDKSAGLVLNLSHVPTVPNCQDETEHYQVPRPQDPIDIGGQAKMPEPIAEELYDDIAIVANFRGRQRDSACSNSSSNDKISSATYNVTRVWNRFASGRKFRTNDLSSENRGVKHNSSEPTRRR